MTDPLGIQMINRFPDTGNICIRESINRDMLAFFHERKKILPQLPGRTGDFIFSQIEPTQPTFLGGIFHDAFGHVDKLHEI